MLSKSTIKLAKSLALKKFRNKEKLFLVEGDKMIAELFNSAIKIKSIFASESFLSDHEDRIHQSVQCTAVDAAEIKKISQLKNPQNSVAICHIPEEPEMPQQLDDDLVLFLDNLQDPGNLGTILRIADWFGVKKVFLSENTVDVYNPKVIQASMGSFQRVTTYRCTFNALKALAQRSEATIYGAFMDGTNIYTEQPATKSILVMGNEGNGISPEVESGIDARISIPNFSNSPDKAESLNVSMATAILCSEFKRRTFSGF